MGFPTDVRHHFDHEAMGIDGLFNNSGTLLSAGQGKTVKEVTNKAGRIERVVFVSKFKTLYCRLLLDGQQTTWGYVDRPDCFVAQNGRCGKVGYIHLVRYDTVNDKYVYVIEGPLEFGNSFKVEVYNPEATSQRAYAYLNWLENV